MHEPPLDLADTEVLRLLRTHWTTDVDRVEHLPVGSGAHHWRASAGFRPVLFATYDDLSGSRPGCRPRSAASLEAAHAGAAELAFRLDVVVAGLPTHELRWTVPVVSGALSATPWVEGERAGDGPPVDREDAERTARMLARLHAVAPPRALPRWESVVDPDLADRLAASLEQVGHDGPLGGEAHGLLTAHLDDVRRWARRHAELLGQAADRPWVTTHGDPDGRHQLVTLVRTLLVDWGSLALAPRERDLLALVRAGHGDLVEPDRAMIELFDLERRLDGVDQLSTWLAAPHGGDADDREALGGLRHALTRA